MFGLIHELILAQFKQFIVADSSKDPKLLAPNVDRFRNMSESDFDAEVNRALKEKREG
jgi:hypothetical protein